MNRILSLAFVLPTLLLATTACNETKKSDLPPPGMAGGLDTPTQQPSPQGTQAVPGSRGAGVNPGAAPSSQPVARAMPSSQPAHQPTAMPSAMPSSQPATARPMGQPGAAADPNMPRVIKGDGPPPVAAAKTFTGTVKESMNAASYTYIRVTGEDGNDVWVAIGETKVAVGQKVKIEESITMTDFHSKTLNRTFPTIVFGILK